MIKDGVLFAEGGELIYESISGEGSLSEKQFREAIKRICWYNDEDLDDAVKELMSSK